MSPPPGGGELASSVSLLGNLQNLATTIVEKEVPDFYNTLRTSALKGEHGYSTLTFYFGVWIAVYIFAAVANRVWILKNTKYSTSEFVMAQKLYYDGTVASGLFSGYIGAFGMWIWLTQVPSTSNDRLLGHDPRVDTCGRGMMAYFVVNTFAMI